MRMTLNMFMIMVATETCPHATDYAAVETRLCAHLRQRFRPSPQSSSVPGSVFLQDEHVTLRTIEAEDIGFLCDCFNDPSVWAYLEAPTPINRITEREYVEERVTDDDSVALLICVGENEADPAGHIAFYPATAVRGSTELSLMLAPEFWGEGYGTAASRLLTTYAFEERRMHRMVAQAIDANVGSCRIWEKLGFRQEGRQKEATYHQGRYMDLLLYAVLEDEWEWGNKN
jgi:RimJ/RimL family protein N-acetyltransferase